MNLRLRCAAFALFACLVVSGPVLAQEPDAAASESDQSEGAKANEAADAGEASGEADYEAARAARAAEDFEEALNAISRAQLAEPDNALYVYERVLILEAMEEPELALKLLEEQKEELLAHPEVDDLVIVEERLVTAIEAADPGEVTDPGTETSNEETASKPVLGYVLVGVGGVFIAGSIGALLVRSSDVDALDSCRPGSSTECLDRDLLDPDEFQRRSDRADSLQIVSIATGAIGLGALAWGIWEIVSHEPAPKKQSVNIAPSVGPNAFGIAVQGRF